MFHWNYNMEYIMNSYNLIAWDKRMFDTSNCKSNIHE